MSARHGFDPEYRATIEKLFARHPDPHDFEIIAAARDTGFSSEELYLDAREIERMRDDLNYRAGRRELLAIATCLARKSGAA